MELRLTISNLSNIKILVMSLKYFEIYTNPLRIYKNFEGIFLTLQKYELPDNTSTGLDNV